MGDVDINRPPTAFELRHGRKQTFSPTRQLIEKKISSLLEHGVPLIISEKKEKPREKSSFGAGRHTSKKVFGLTGAIREKYSDPKIALPPHLRGDIEKRKDLLRRVDLELQRCCDTTREQLQKKINGCKVTLEQNMPCETIHNDSKLSTQQKLLLYSKNMVEFNLCRDYRKMMNRAFAAETDFKEYWQSQSYNNHLRQENIWQEEAEKCRRHHTQAMAYMEARRQ